MKLGSLFDGSGGFPLAATMSGITPVWASEVEPYPIAVTRSRFPKMKHLGDISRVNGAEIEPVDIITFGSPCQDMSVAGKREGIKHSEHGDEETTRSGLFYEAIRIIKEMRENDKASGRTGVDVRPRFIIWENVAGAFSSNGGNLVLEEIIKITEPSAVMPDVPKGGWAYADSYRGDGWSISYRVFDAQYWGVPQRRRRIYLVADFGGQRAGEILFEREGLRGYFAESREERKGAPEYAERSPLADDREGSVCYGISSQDSNAMKSSNPYSGIYVADTSRTLDLNGGNPVCNQGGIAVIEGVYSVENHPADSRVGIDKSGTVQTLTSRMGTGGGNVPMVMTPFRKSTRAKSADDATVWVDGDIANCLNTFDQGETRCNELVVESTAYSFDPGASRDVGEFFIKECNKPLTNGTCPGHHDGVVIAFDRAAYNQGENAQYDFEVTESGVNSTIVAKGPSGVCYSVDTTHADDVVRINPYTTPTLRARDFKGGNAVCYWDGEDTTGTLTARNAGGSQRMPDKDNFIAVIEKPHYIVRRLTPTECARLQGFPDRWGDIDHKDDMTAEEYGFWREVRMTYDRINGRKEKEYTDAQILKWCNALHNDGAEYKMWGNGIALPCAYYIMRKIARCSE